MKNPLKAFLISLIVLLIFFIAIPQNDITQSLAISLLVFIWSFTIFLIGIPAWRDSVRIYLDYLTPFYIILLFVLFPYIVILLSNGAQPSSIIELALWYLLPTSLFLLPEVVETRINPKTFVKFRIGVNVIAAGVLWIGFDHRYTGVIFEGYTGASYTLNAIWMACIMMITFGRYIGIEDPENEHDKGMTPNSYGIKIANIATPIASILVIPFGLLTGFLQWNPQEFNILLLLISFIGIYLTIALEEEFVFRGIIQNELIKLKIARENKYIEYGIIILVTIAFALTHWNNEVPVYVYHYFLTAFIAGLAYAYSYKKGGLFASMLAHTLVDWIWALLLKRA